jgi:hypothetical protein
VSEAVGG